MVIFLSFLMIKQTVHAVFISPFYSTCYCFYSVFLEGGGGGIDACV